MARLAASLHDHALEDYVVGAEDMPEGLVAVRIDAKAFRVARSVARQRGESVSEWIEQVVIQVSTEAIRRMLGEGEFGANPAEN
jgi:hypothetical protein